MSKVLFWHRRDLRLEDNRGLNAAVASGKSVYPIFIFDSNILSQLPKNDQRVLFIHQEIERLHKEYEQLGGRLHVYHGDPKVLLPQLAVKIKAYSVFTNKDYEPYAVSRDHEIKERLEQVNIQIRTFKDHVIFEESEVVKADGSPYTVYTPYSKKWKQRWLEAEETVIQFPKAKINWYTKENEIPSLKDLGFSSEQTQEFPSREFNIDIIRNYHETRDVPSIRGTSRLSLHLRFGTISIRKLVKTAWSANEKFLNELIWRDFYQAIIHHFPYSATGNFRAKYDGIKWRNNEQEFELWCKGKTGYPIVDAGMRELNETGLMHNRVRMVVASFLCKHLLIDWRWGEGYFAEKLLDYELASNVGGWQWASGTGCDAAPYFRVFNPTRQQEKFDPKGTYIRLWMPEIDNPSYPPPMVDHKVARQRAIDTYKKGLN